MAFKRPSDRRCYRVGDIKGTIIGLSFRDTQVKTLMAKMCISPMVHDPENPGSSTTPLMVLRQEFDIGLDYGSDISQAIKVIPGHPTKGTRYSTKEKAPAS